LCMDEFILELNEQIISKSLREIPDSKLRYYYNIIYKEKLKENCSSCFSDAYQRIKIYYRAQVGLLQKERWTANDVGYLKIAFIHFKEENKPEHCEWILNKINQLK